MTLGTELLTSGERTPGINAGLPKSGNGKLGNALLRPWKGKAGTPWAVMNGDTVLCAGSPTCAILFKASVELVDTAAAAADVS